MATSHQRAQRGADSGGVSPLSIDASASAKDGVSGQNAAEVTAENIDWLISRLRAMAIASPTVWAGRGMTLLQLITLHFISALAPVTLTDLAQTLGTRLPATSAMVERLAHAGLVSRTPDPQNRRRIQLTITTAAEPIVGDTDAATARRLHALLHGMSSQTRRRLIDILIDSVRRSAH
jgi:DNA-binding MarR family transcriptional regulator